MAFGKGLSTRRVIPVHVLRNSLIPVITFLAADFGILIVGATVTEGIFNVPVSATRSSTRSSRHEDPTVVSFVTVSWSSTSRQPARSTCSTRCSTRGSAMSSKNPAPQLHPTSSPRVDDAALGASTRFA